MKLYPLFITALCICPVAFADMVSLNPVADTTVSENNAALADGGTGHMIVGHLDPGHANVMSRGLLRFDLSGIPVDASVVSVTLAVTVLANASPNTDIHTVHRLNAAWIETTGNWIHSGVEEWMNGGGDYQSTADGSNSIPVGIGTFTFSSTLALVNTVQMWVTNSASNHGWVLRSQSEIGGRNARRFTTREASTDRPTLIVEYTAAPPPPPTINITSPRVADGKFKFDFTAEGGFSYIAQYKEALRPGDWTDLAWIPDPGVSTPTTVEDPLTATNRFYRIVVATWP